MVRMAGLIVRKDIDLVRERTDLKAVVEEFVTLRTRTREAGVRAAAE